MEKLLCEWRDENIYKKAKGVFFIQAIKFEDNTYNVMIDSLWKDNWQLPLEVLDENGNIVAKTKDVGNPKLMLGLSNQQFNELFIIFNNENK